MCDPPRARVQCIDRLHMVHYFDVPNLPSATCGNVPKMCYKQIVDLLPRIRESKITHLKCLVLNANASPEFTDHKLLHDFMMHGFSAVYA